MISVGCLSTFVIFATNGLDAMQTTVTASTANGAYVYAQPSGPCCEKLFFARAGMADITALSNQRIVPFRVQER